MTRSTPTDRARRCRRCGAPPGQACVTTAGNVPMARVHAERRPRRPPKPLRLDDDILGDLGLMDHQRGAQGRLW